jgi:hypothetical protein
MIPIILNIFFFILSFNVLEFLRREAAAKTHVGLNRWALAPCLSPWKFNDVSLGFLPEMLILFGLFGNEWMVAHRFFRLLAGELPLL